MTRHAKAMLVRLITTALAVAGVGLVTFTAAPTAQAAPGDIGFADYQYGPPLIPDPTTGFIDPDNSPTASKPQSKLWFAQGTWWGVLQVPGTTTTTIHSLNPATQSWVDTGVTIDARTTPTQSDTLWDGTKLYVVSAGRNGSTAGIRVSRFRYDAAQSTYVPDGLATNDINGGGVEAAVIAKDSAGRLWIAYTAGAAVGRVVRVLVSDTAQTTFGAAFTPPVDGTAVTSDDIATIVSHNKSVSVVWSNQNVDAATGNTAVYAARHPDTAAPETGWVAAEKVLNGPSVADDHISLSGVEGNAAGGVFMVVKESADDPAHANTAEGLVRLLVLRANGVWESYVHSTVKDDMTRPIIELEPGKGLLHVFATSPVAGGVVYRKTTSMANPSFAAGKGEPFIKLAGHPLINNATSTKQNITAESGILVLASDQTTGTYVHNYVPGIPTANFTFTPAAGPAPLAVQFTDTSTGAPASWTWDFGDGGTSGVQNPSYTYTKAGTYTAKLTVTNAGGSTTKTATVTVGVSVPVAGFTYTPTTGPAPLAVKFTDTSTGPPASWAWSFGDGGTSAAQSPSYTFAKAGTYTVTLKVTNASGSSTKTATVVVGAAPPPVPVVLLDGPDAAFTMSRYVDVAWHATTDPASIKGYDVEVTSIGARRGSTSRTTVLSDLTGSGLRMPGRPGTTYCLRVRGTNVAGVVGAWSESRCTALPIDDRRMSRSDEWRGTSRSRYYLGTAMVTRDRGAVLAKTVTGKQVFLLVTRRAGGGRVKVYEGDHLVKRVSLAARSTQAGQLIKIASHSRDTTARYRVVVVSSGKPVIIDGIAVTR